ncbi:MAG: DUF58 domain-containing protein, partial [Nocardiopsis sp. BM-2018]
MVVTGRAALLALLATGAVAISGDIGGTVTYLSVGLVLVLVALDVLLATGPRKLRLSREGDTSL